jgi:hypothetical protein
MQQKNNKFSSPLHLSTNLSKINSYGTPKKECANINRNKQCMESALSVNEGLVISIKRCLSLYVAWIARTN